MEQNSSRACSVFFAARPSQQQRDEAMISRDTRRTRDKIAAAEIVEALEIHVPAVCIARSFMKQRKALQKKTGV